MPTPQKEQIVKEMTDKFSKASSIFMADFTGMDVNLLNQLRKSFRESRVEYRVVKNTLARMCVKNAGIGELEKYIVGVNSYMISYDDPTLPVKVVEKMKKELNEKFKIKAAYLEGQVVGPDKVEALAKLPGRDELYSMLLGLLQSPLVKFASLLQSNMVKLVGALKALEEKKK